MILFFLFCQSLHLCVFFECFSPLCIPSPAHSRQPFCSAEIFGALIIALIVCIVLRLFHLFSSSVSAEPSAIDATVADADAAAPASLYFILIE